MSTLGKLVSWVSSIVVLCALSVGIVNTAGWTVLLLFGLICLLGKTIELTQREIADLKRKVVELEQSMEGRTNRAWDRLHAMEERLDNIRQ